MDNGLVHAQDVFLSKVNQMCNKFGLNNIMAQLYAILYLNQESLSLDELSERLKISKGSASVNLRALERYGAVRRVWIKGSRKDYYEAETDIAKVIVDRLRSMAQGRLLEFDDMIKSSYDILNSVRLSEGERKESVKVFKERLDRLRRLHTKAQTLFNLFNSGLLNKLLMNKRQRKNL